MSSDSPRVIFRELQKLARADYHGNTGPLLVVYGVEGFLRRLAASHYATKMTLKGGMLMAATATRRMTKDADLSTVGVANEPGHITQVVADIATIELDPDDGLAFDVDTIRAEAMREQAEYHGVRAKIQAHLATAKLTVTLDFSFGDPHRSVVIELPELLGTGSIRLASYPPELTLAEKIATMMSRRELNTRDRDFADVWTLSRTLTLSAASLRAAITEVADHRRHDVIPLSEALAELPDRQVPYAAMLSRMAYQRPLPPSWSELLVDVCAFVDPLVTDADERLGSWDPADRVWQPG
jgi:nucleotidyltransferase AbiEii toxin of type IV toxin-antitoxin system